MVEDIINNEIVKAYVDTALTIFKGSADLRLLEKSKGLEKIVPMDPEWLDFVAAVHDENDAVLLPHLAFREHYKSTWQQRQDIMRNMFKKFGVSYYQ